MTAAEERIIDVLPAWGSFRLVSPLSGGNRNPALLIDLHDNPAVAKSTRRSEEAVEWLDPVLERASRAGFRVPHYLSSLDERRVVDGVTVETWLEGKPPPAEELGRALDSIRRLHGMTRDIPQRPGFCSSQELLAENVGGDVDLTRMPEVLVAACRTAWRSLAGWEQSVVHGDLNRSNLILAEDGRLGLVDWDEARVDCSLLDEAALRYADRLPKEAARSDDALAQLAWEVAASWNLEPEYARKLSGELMKAIGGDR